MSANTNCKATKDAAEQLKTLTGVPAVKPSSLFQLMLMLPVGVSIAAFAILYCNYDKRIMRNYIWKYMWKICLNTTNLQQQLCFEGKIMPAGLCWKCLLAYLASQKKTEIFDLAVQYSLSVPIALLNFLMVVLSLRKRS